MPTYCYTNDASGQTVERFFSMEKAPRRVRVAGKSFTRDIGAEHGAARGRRRGVKLWPQTSLAMGVAPSGIKARQAQLRARGVHAEFSERGDCVVESNTHRNKLMKAMGVGDCDAGYGQKAPGD